MKIIKMVLIAMVMLLVGLEPNAWAFDDKENYYEHSGRHISQPTIWGREDLVNRHRHLSVAEKARATNRFFNQIPYVPDLAAWGVKDYWATPDEFIEKGAGDCEDFAIAKFYALKNMGVPVNRLVLAFVKVRNMPENHVVLLVYGDDDSNPFVLDSLMSGMYTLDERRDLLVLFTFDERQIIVRQGENKFSYNSTEKMGAWARVVASQM